jgi:spoIIIJ-associated protein
MEWVETTGRTVEEAKDNALDQLGVDETDAEFVIVAEPRPGLFGRMRGEARVRARVAPTSPRPKRGRRRQGQDQRRSGGRSRSSGAATAVAVADEVEIESPADGGQSANGAQRPAGGTSTGTRRRRSRGGRGRGGAGQGQSPGAQAAGRASGQQGDRESAGSRQRAADRGKEETVGEVLSLEDQGEAARAFIAGLVDELGLDAQVSVKTLDEDTAEVVVQGEALGILIGPGGATLAALQELARTVVQKQTGGHSDRILVDVAGYRARRAEALQRFTRQVAEEVLTSGTERALEPMSAADRKVVHDTVNEISGVATRSEGEDPRRHIVISPAADEAPSDG